MSFKSANFRWHDPAKTKAELIKYPKDSFDYSNRVLALRTPGGMKNSKISPCSKFSSPRIHVGMLCTDSTEYLAVHVNSNTTDRIPAQNVYVVYLG